MARRHPPAHVKAECDRCGRIYKLVELRREWTNYLVCPDCWDPKTKQEFPDPIQSEDPAIRNARPRNDIVVNHGQAVTSIDFIPRSFTVGAGICEIGKVLIE